MTARGGPPGVRIALCGELRLELDGRRRERELPGRLGRVLLAYLALNRRRAIPRDELIAALWPDDAPADPGRTLSTLLSGLRRSLGADRVPGRSQVRLDLPEDAEIDVERAVDHARQARSALGERDLDRSAAHAEAAIEVLERDLLPGFDAPWVEDQRRELEEHVLSALELLARASLTAERDGVARAQSASRRLVALAPFRESGYALLMEAQAARGNVAEALQTFDRLRRLMRDELGTTPSPQVRETHRRLLERVDDGGACPHVLPAAVARLASRPFVGRQDTLARLDGLLADAGRGERRFALLAGEPGIGKSSLAARFARQAHECGDTVVLHGGAAEQRVMPFQPFVEIISHWVENGRVDDAAEQYGDELEALGRLVPALRRRFPNAHRLSGGDADAERYQLFEAMAAIMAREVGDGTLVAVLEDLHWADRATLMITRLLARAPTLPRLLVVATYRDTEVEPGSPLDDLIADLRRERVLVHLPVVGLSERETAALIGERRLSGLPAGAAGRLRRTTGGNPLFLDEMLVALADAAADGVAAEDALADLGVSEGIKEVVLRRVDRLEGPARKVLSLAAVAGQTFRPFLLLGQPGVPAEEVEGVLDEAVDARLLVRENEAELSFAHAVVREALYESLGDLRRARLHLLVAQALEHRGDPAELSRHFFAARHLAGPEPAIRHARAAAERATASLDWDDAVVELERALDADELRDPPDLEDRCDLLLALGDARRRAGHADARQAFRDAAQIARGRFPEQLARAAIDWASPYFQTAAVDEERITLMREALAALPSGRGDLRARLLTSLAESRQFAGRSKEAAQLSAQALSLAERLGDDEVLIYALSGRHLSLMHAENLDERLRMGSRLVDLAQRMGDRERELHALHPRLFDLLEEGNLARARAARDRLAELGGQLRQPLFAHFAVVWSCTFAQIDGRLDEAEGCAREAYEIRCPHDPRGAERVLAGQLFMVRRAQGRLAEAYEDAVAARAKHPGLSVWRAAVPLAQAAAGDGDGARADVERQVAKLESVSHDLLWLGSMWLLAEAAAELRMADAAGPLYEALAPYADRWAQAGQGGNGGPIAHTLGVLAALRGHSETALVHLDDAVRRSADAGAAAFEARARADRDRVLARAAAT